MSQLTFTQFREEYKKSLKNDEKFSAKVLGERWKQYKSENTTQSTKEMQKVSQNKNESSVFRVKPQSTEITTKKVEIQEEQNTQTQQESRIDTTNTEVGFTDDSMYEVVADSVHNALAGIIAIATNKAVQMQKEQISRLNVAGVQMLKKYDINGNILEYSPEIAYILTLADISAQIFVEVKRQKTQSEREEQQTQIQQQTQETKSLPAPAPTKTDEAKKFGNLLKN